MLIDTCFADYFHIAYVFYRYLYWTLNQALEAVCVNVKASDKFKKKMQDRVKKVGYKVGGRSDAKL